MQRNQLTIAIIGCLVSTFACLLGVRMFAVEFRTAEPCVRTTVVEVVPIMFDSASEWTKAEVVIRNDGNRRMVARVEDPDCDCSLKAKAVRIEPRKQKRLEFYVYSRSIRNSMTLNVQLATNDSANSEIPVTFEIKGTEGNLNVPENAKSVLTMIE